MFGTNRAPILHRQWFPTDRNKIPLDPHHLEVPAGVSKMISEPMVCSAQTMHLSCVKVSTDEDIPSIDTTTPAAQQGPMTRARARQLNYQVKSFLAIHTNSSQNWMLLNHGDDCLILWNVSQDPIASF